MLKLIADHSTSELPFQMDNDFERLTSPRNHLVQRFRATTEPPADYRQKMQPRTPSNNVNQPHSKSSLENDTIALKNLLSINTPKHSTSPAPLTPNGDGPPSPSPVNHSRTRSVAQPHLRRSPPSDSQPSRRVVSTSGAPSYLPNPLQHPSDPSPSIPSNEYGTDPSKEDQAVKAEHALRKVLNLY